MATEDSSQMTENSENKSPIKDKAVNGAENTAVTNGKESTMDSEEKTKKIIKQIEYYFGDYNLPRDKFLKEEVR